MKAETHPQIIAPTHEHEAEKEGLCPECKTPLITKTEKEKNHGWSINDTFRPDGSQYCPSCHTWIEPKTEPKT